MAPMGSLRWEAAIMMHRTWIAAAVVLVGLGSCWADEDKANIEKDFPSKKVTLTGQMPLPKALEELKKQTGIEVEDRTETGDLAVKLNLTNVTFWQALEAIAKEADVRVVPVLGEKKAGLVPGPYKALPIHFQGPFRSVVKRISAVRDLETDAHNYTVDIEVAWEPGIRPFFRDAVPPDLEVTDDKGRLLKVEEEGMGRLPVNTRSAEVNIRLGEIPRSTPRIGSMKGTINLFGPTKWLDFSFADLSKAKGAEQKLDGVSAKISQLTLDK